MLHTYHQIAEDLNLWSELVYWSELVDPSGVTDFHSLSTYEKVQLIAEAFGPDQVFAIDEVDADFETGEWLTAPHYSGNTVHRIDWSAMQDFDGRAFSTYEKDGETRAIILNWKT